VVRPPVASPPASPEESAPATAADLSHRRLAAGASAKLGTEALARIASFGVLLLAARQLGPGDFGTYLYGLGMGFVLAQGADFGLQLLIAREVAIRGRAAAPLVRMAVGLKLALSAAIVLLFVPLTIGHPPLVRIALAALGAAMVLQTFIEFTGHVFRGHQQLYREVHLLTSTRLLAAAAAGLVLWLDGRLLPLAIVVLATALAGSALAGWMLFRQGWLGTDAPAGYGAAGAARVRIGELIRGALPLGVGIVLSVVYLRAGWVLLYHLTGQEAVGQLGAAQRLMEAAQLVPAAAMAAIFPAYARALRTDGSGARRLGRSGAGTLAVLGGVAAVTIWLTADWAMPALFGPAYRHAAPILQVLALGVPLMFVNYLLTHLLIARGRQALVAWFGAAVLACHLAASWYLIPRWGPVGVAASMVLAESVLLLCCLAALRDRAGTAVTPHASFAGAGPLSRAGRLAGMALVALLAGMLPFEVALWEIPGLVTVTTLELLAAGIFVAAALALSRPGGAAVLRVVPAAWAVLLAAFLVWLPVSAALAPELGGNALRASARTAMGVALAGSIIVLVRTRRELYLVIAAATGGGLAAAGIGLWELAQADALAWLGVFRDQVTKVGPFRGLTRCWSVWWRLPWRPAAAAPRSRGRWSPPCTCRRVSSPTVAPGS
jgi:O-antigen/teichoic acid export membrane protein